MAGLPQGLPVVVCVEPHFICLPTPSVLPVPVSGGCTGPAWSEAGPRGGVIHQPGCISPLLGRYRPYPHNRSHLLPRRPHSRRGIIRRMSTSPPPAPHLGDLALLRRVRDRIDREYARPLDVEALARGVNMSAGHLSRQFRLAYGEPPYSYLMTRRIERAMALLRRGDLSVTEVCFAVGCSSLGTFSSRFTELVGVPPSVFRERQDLAGQNIEGMPACVAKQVTRPVRKARPPRGSAPGGEAAGGAEPVRNREACTGRPA